MSEQLHSGLSEQLHNPARHYDRVTAAWTLLLGEELHYGVFATGYEQLAHATRQLTELMVQAAAVEPAMHVLDLGCGTGAQACFLAARYGARVTAITTSAEGVRATQERVAAAALEHLVRCEQRDGTDTGFDERSFDRIWVLESSHLMRDRRGLIEECSRLLKPGGRLALCDIVLRRELPLLEVRRLREQLVLLREVFGDARMEPLSRYRELLGASGLDVDLERDLTGDTRPTFAWWRANARRHRQSLIALIGEQALAGFIEACNLLERFWDDGTLGYGLIAANRSGV